MFRAFFPRDVFAEFNRLQQELQNSFDISPSIRGRARGGFPAVNIGNNENAVEIYAFVPGVDPASIEAQVERGVLTISGERKTQQPERDAQTAMHIGERFSGRFRRVISLSDDLDATSASAKYNDGVLHISIKRREATQPRRINIH